MRSFYRHISIAVIPGRLLLHNAKGSEMSDCCCSHSSENARQHCPECDCICKPVSMATLYHQVRFPENQMLPVGSYCFCPGKTCSVAYFSSMGHSVPKKHLRSYQAIQNDVLCYCFDIGAHQYLSALKAHRAGSIKDFVIQRTRAGECACEIRNPSGQCCLTNFKRLENT